MKNVILQKTRPYFARVDCGEPQTFFRFLELAPDDFVFHLFAKDGEKILKRFGPENFPKNLVTSAIAGDYFELEKGAEKKQFLDTFVDHVQADAFLHIQGDIKPEYRHGKEESGRVFLDKIMTRDTMPTYVSLRNWTEPCYASLHFSRKLKTTHVVIDPQEAHLSDNLFFFYENPRIGAKYVPFIEYGMFRWAQTHATKEKTKGFTFGFTVVTEDRVAIYNEIKKIEAQNVNFLVRYPSIGVDTCVKKRLYDEMLEESRYTLIIPSYEAADFSSIRFWEALFRACVPLIHSSCAWEQAFEEFPEIREVIRKHLCVNTEDISSRVGMDYQVPLKALVETNDWKKLNSLQWYREKTAPFFASL